VCFELTLREGCGLHPACGVGALNVNHNRLANILCHCFGCGIVARQKRHFVVRNRNRRIAIDCSSFVFALPNLKHEELLAKLANRQPDSPKTIGGYSSRVTVDRSPKPFEPDGVLGGVPYRVVPDGSIHAVMQGATVKFENFEKFTKAVGN
jgi:hypothetical protein